MNKLYKSLTKLPDIEKEVISIKPNGKRVVSTVKVTNRYLLLREDGNSVAMTGEQLAKLGIVIDELLPEKADKKSTKAEKVEKVEEVVEDDEPEAAEDAPVTDLTGMLLEAE